MILCTNGLKKETLKLQFHTRSPVNSNDHAVFFPGKPRLLRDWIKRKPEIKVLFCCFLFFFKFEVNRNLKLKLSHHTTTPPPPTPTEHTSSSSSQAPRKAAQNRTRAAAAFIPQHLCYSAKSWYRTDTSATLKSSLKALNFSWINRLPGSPGCHSFTQST